MCCHIYVDTIGPDCSSTVLCNINLAIDHYFGTVWDLTRIHSDRTVGSGRYSCGSNSIRPWSAADAARTIMRDPECSQWFQCRVRRYGYRRSDLYASCGTSGTTCGSYTIHCIRKNPLPGTLGKGSCFCVLFLLCLGHFRSLIAFQTAGRNISDVI